jgi:hypothetical protein
MPVIYQSGLFSLVLGQHCKLIESGIKGISLSSVLFISVFIIGSYAASIELKDYKMQELGQSVNNFDVVFMDAVKERNNFEEDMLKKSVVAEAASDIKE